MASIEEVWGAPFPKKQKYDSKNPPTEQKRDAQKEGRVYNSPVERTQAAMFKHKKTIDDLSQSLPIVATDEEANSNYKPYKSRVREEMTDYAYAPPAYQNNTSELKLNRILHMIEQNRVGYETGSTQDMLLYVFTGIFFLYTLDTFVSLGKRIR